MQFRFLLRGLKTRFRDQRCELKQLLQGLRPHETAVDVGANKGSYLWSLSRAVSRGKVVAFEPQPDLAEYLRGAVVANGLKNVRIEHLGVSERPGRLTLTIPGDKPNSPGASFESDVCKSGRSIEVGVTSLDEYFKNTPGRVGAIKIDVEGHEIAVLRGAAELIRRDAPVIVCESESRHVAGNVEALIELLENLNYEGGFVHRQQLKSLAQFDPAVHQAPRAGRFWDHPDYCNNFVFRRAG